MRIFRISLAVGTLLCGLSTVAEADCKRLAAVGDGLTKDIAEVMSTHGLMNIMSDRGLKGQGPVKTKCGTGTLGAQCHSSQMACK